MCEGGSPQSLFYRTQSWAGHRRENERIAAQPGEAEVGKKVSRGEADVRKIALQQGTLSHSLPG